MIVGLDFDNTIVSYDTLFHRVAHEQGLIPSDLPDNKTAVRDHLRATGREALWTELQGTVYGARIGEAEAYPGALDFLRSCRRRGVAVRIISHKTRHPYLGERHDLHAAARAWLRTHGFIDPANTGLRDEDVFFELTKAEKLQRIASCGCTHFIDDLPELLAEPAFPRNVSRLLFDPSNLHPQETGRQRIADWPSVTASLFQDGSRTAKWTKPLADPALALSSTPWQPLHGGANNRVYRITLATGETALAKHYFQHASDTRNRFAVERAFYQYAAVINLRQMPQALGWNEADQIGFFALVAGETPVAAEAIHVEAALRFLAELNCQRHRPEALALPQASEACFSLAAHLDSVQRRVGRMYPIHSEDAVDAEAHAFVQHDLLPAWQAVRSTLRREYDSLSCARRLAPHDCCISPSDFGFHNCLVQREGGIVFLDFEYAGWDDPAKLVCDFFCQPDVPVSLEHFDRFVAATAEALSLPEAAAFAARCRALLPVYQLKWSCILLNDFTGSGRARRIFSLGTEAAAARRRRQLTRARTALGTLRHAA